MNLISFLYCAAETWLCLRTLLSISCLLCVCCNETFAEFLCVLRAMFDLISWTKLDYPSFSPAVVSIVTTTRHPTPLAYISCHFCQPLSRTETLVHTVFKSVLIWCTRYGRCCTFYGHQCIVSVVTVNRKLNLLHGGTQWVCRHGFE